MSDPIAQAKALVSALGAATKVTLRNAAREAEWQQKKGSISTARLGHIFRQLKALGLDGEQAAPAALDLPEPTHAVHLLCELCACAVMAPVDGGEVEARAELYRYVVRRPTLHSDFVLAALERPCHGLLRPVGIGLIAQ